MKKVSIIGAVILIPWVLIGCWIYYTWHLERYHGTYCDLGDKGGYQYIGRDDMLTGMLALRHVGSRYLRNSNGSWVYDDDGNVMKSAEVSKSEAVAIAKAKRAESPGKYERPFYRFALRNPEVYWRSFANPYDRRFYDTNDYIKSCDIYKVLN